MKKKNDSAPVANRFDLEQYIYQVWNTKQDIDLLCRHMDGSEPMTDDEVANALIGISALHEMRSQQLWDCFETLIHERKII